MACISKYITPVAIIVLALSVSLRAATEPVSFELISADEQSGLISYFEASALRVIVVLDPNSAPARYQVESVPSSVGVIKCATALALEAERISPSLSPQTQAELSALLVRPATELSYDTPGGFIRLHYDTSGANAVPALDNNNNDIPDFIEKMAGYADSAWKTQIDILGYLTPPDDESRGGDGLYDIYFQDILAYGITIGEFPGPELWNDYSSYIICHHTFEGFQPNQDPEGSALGSAKVTLAHEIHHAIQLAYDKAAEIWYMEASATCMEEIIFDSSNDNYNKLPAFFSAPQTPLTSNSLQTDHFYGAFIWPLYLSERFDTTLLRQVWEGARYSTVMEALADTLSARFGVSRDSAFIEFLSWTYLTGSRDNGTGFSEGGAYPEMIISGIHSAYPVPLQFAVKSPSGYSSSAFRFFPSGSNGTAKFAFDGHNGRNWAALIIATRNGNEHELFWSKLDFEKRGAGAVDDFDFFDEVTLVGINLSAYTLDASFKYFAEIVSNYGLLGRWLGDTISYTLADNPVGLNLRNLGSQVDSFSIAVRDNSGWELSPAADSLLVLAPGAETTFVARVSPPAGTVPGAGSTVRIIARSQNDPSAADSVAIRQAVSVLTGDANWSGSLNLADVTYIIAWMFTGGPAPQPDLSSADQSCDGKVNIVDVIHIINRIFLGAALPPCQALDPLESS